MNPILGKLGATHDLGVDGSLESPCRLSIRVNWTFFDICYGSGVMRRNVYSSAVFTGGRPLCTQILPGQGGPHQPFLASVNYRLPDGEDSIPLCSLVLTQYRSVSDIRIDRRTDGFAVAYIALAKLALRRAVKSNNQYNIFTASQFFVRSRAI